MFNSYLPPLYEHEDYAACNMHCTSIQYGEHIRCSTRTRIELCDSYCNCISTYVYLYLLYIELRYGLVTTLIVHNRLNFLDLLFEEAHHRCANSHWRASIQTPVKQPKRISACYWNARALVKPVSDPISHWKGFRKKM